MGIQRANSSSNEFSLHIITMTIIQETSSEEPWSTETVAARCQYGNLIVSKVLSLNLNFNVHSQTSLLISSNVLCFMYKIEYEY